MSKIAVIGLVGNSAFLSVDSFHKGGETIVAKEIHFEPGGKGFNQAVSAARFGADVSFLGAVGGDYIDEARQFLENENIKPYLVKKQGNSPYACILTDSAGENRVTVYSGVTLSENDVDLFAKEIASSDVLLINNEVPEEVNERATKIAKEKGVLVILNPAPSKPIMDYLLENVDIFTPNQHETEFLNGKQNIVITLGGNGCLIKETGKILPPLDVGIPVDTTGAGDCFNGVFATALGDGFNVETSARLAIVASGVSVTRKYAVSSLPYKNELKVENLKFKINNR